ncbi:MAG: hypothetical protein ACRD4V_08680 [Candidatus Acidiferrales bacterium]
MNRVDFDVYVRELVTKEILSSTEVRVMLMEQRKRRSVWNLN